MAPANSGRDLSSTRYLLSAPEPKVLAQANSSSRIVVDDTIPIPKSSNNHKMQKNPSTFRRSSNNRSKGNSFSLLNSNVYSHLKGNQPSRASSVTSSITSATATTANIGNSTAVYVRDEVYVWIPAILHRTDEVKGTASIIATLPEDWAECTLRHPQSSITELEFTHGEQQCFDHVPEPVPNTRRSSAFHYDVNHSVERGVYRTVALKDYPNEELPLQNIAQHNGRRMSMSNNTIMMVSDMADLPFLHEAAILYNLKERHANKLPYTRVGDIVVAMNPFVWIDGLYCKEKQTMYAQHLIWDTSQKQDVIEEGSEEERDEDSDQYNFDQIPEDNTITAPPQIKHDPYLISDSYYAKLGFQPHVYETSSLAYRGLAMENTNQTILVSGESGAGKTETVKIVLSHLATVERTRPFFSIYSSNRDSLSGTEESTVQRVLEANPLFEAFGNAKTSRNDNSSRFGRFTQLQFDVESKQDASRAGRENIPNCLLAGSYSETYLLEKSRVVGHDFGERSYHIFYQLLAAPEDEKILIWEGLKGTNSDSFLYVSDIDTNSIDGISDAEGWNCTVKALHLFGIRNESFQTLMQALCIVMQLGNLSFDVGIDGDNDKSVVTSTVELEKLSDLMGIESEVIVKAMTKRVNIIRKEEMVANLKPKDAKDGCDALAKEIYSKVFDVLTKTINEYTEAKQNDDRSIRPVKPYGVIGLLDIFGFEKFDTNRFEQLCINYANERLQQAYVLDNFKAVQCEYEAEGIEIFDFTTVDNSGVVDLLEGKMGLMASLNEECIRPNGTNDSFVYKAKMVHASSSHMLTDRLHGNCEFGVKHFAGPVTYNSEQFIVRNSDLIPPDLVQCTAKTTNSLVKEEFSSILISMNDKKFGLPRRKSVTVNRTVLAKFRSQLNTLMKNIHETRTRYIRCIKPNNFMIPKKTDHWTTVRQLKCAGLVTAITISRESFPNRLGYEVTWDRFVCLLKDDEIKSFGGILKEKVNNLLTMLLDKPFLRADGALVLPFACGKTRVYFRTGALERLESERMLYYSIRAAKIQTLVRCIFGRRRYISFRNALILLQTRARQKQAKEKFKLGIQSVVTIQCLLRNAFAKAKVTKLKQEKASIIIQSRWRGMKPRENFVRSRGSTLVIQKFLRKRTERNTLLKNLSVVAEEARMERNIANLQAQVNDDASVFSSGDNKHVDENLLEDIEGMFEYLKEETNTLRKKNSELENEVKELQEAKHILSLHSESVTASGTITHRQMHQLQNEISRLKKDVREKRKKNSELKKEIKNQYISHQNELVRLNDEFDEIINSRAMEMAVIKEEMLSSRVNRQNEIEILKDELCREREDHSNEVRHLREEIRRTQDSHNDYLAKLMDVLETTHASRELEVNKTKEKLTALCREKDKEISKLKNEVSRLQSKKNFIDDDLGARIQKKYDDIVEMRDELKRRNSARMNRSSKYEMISRRLQNLISTPSPTNDVMASPRTWRKNKKQIEGRTGDDTKQMLGLLFDLDELFKDEEKSHSDVDIETIKRMDEVLQTAESTLDSLETKAMLKGTLVENETLKLALDDLRKISSNVRKSERRHSLHTHPNVS